MFWNVRATPRAMILSGRRPVMSLSANTIRPVEGLYSPVSMLKNVVLPAPLGPMIETIERGGIEKSMPSTATRPPKIFEMSSGGQQLRAGAVARARRVMPRPSNTVSSAPTPSVSSSLRRRSGNRPSGLSTIITTRMNPNTPNLTSSKVKSSPAAPSRSLTHPLVEHVGDQAAC